METEREGTYNIEPLTVEQFADALAKGLGRTYLCVREHGAKAYRETILHACIHDGRYDHQLCASLAPYMMDIIDVVGEEPFYRDASLQALAAAKANDFDTWHLLEMACEFAKRGSAEARAAVYAAFERFYGFDRFACEHLGDSQIVEMDGIDGLLYVMERSSDPERDIDSLIWSLEERDGKESAWAALDLAAQTNERLAEAIKAYWQEQAEREQKFARAKGAPPTRPQMSYKQVKAIIEARTGKYPRVFIGWGRSASEQDLQNAARDMQQAMLPVQRRCYLSIFSERPFPGDHRFLTGLVRNAEDLMVSWAASEALSQIAHPDVRELAIEIYGDPERRHLFANLLKSNYEEGDYALLIELLRQEFDAFDLHGLCRDIADLIELHPSPSITECRIALYGKNPCSSCRRWLVEKLAEGSELPEWMREECRWDSDEDTRKLVAPTESEKGSTTSNH